MYNVAILEVWEYLCHLCCWTWNNTVSAKDPVALFGTRIYMEPLRIKSELSLRKVVLLALTHWGRDKMTAFLQTTYLNAFSWMKMYEFRLKFHRNLFLRGINKIPALVHIMAWRRLGDKPLSEPMMFRYATHIYVTRPQWVNGNYW